MLILPEGANDAERGLLDRFVSGRRRAWKAKTHIGRRSAESCCGNDAVIPAKICAAVIAVIHRFGRDLILKPANSRIGVHQRQRIIRAHDKVWAETKDEAAAAIAIKRRCDKVKV